MSTPQCPLRFEGAASSFVERWVQAISLEPEQLTRADEQVRRALERSPLLLVRNFGQFQEAARPARPYRCDDALSFVVCDNEPVVWFWRRHRENERFDLLDAIEQQSLPISMAPSNGEREKNWKTWGNGDAPLPRDRWRGCHGGRWKLCHVFQAAWAGRRWTPRWSWASPAAGGAPRGARRRTDRSLPATRSSRPPRPATPADEVERARLRRDVDPDLG